MKHGKAPSLAQKKFLKSRGLADTEWYIVKDTKELMEIVSKRELAKCKMNRISGTGKKPRTRILRKDES